ncbi:MAG: hypothetical protein ACLS90_07225 [Clostridia bacterium]
MKVQKNAKRTQAFSDMKNKNKEDLEYESDSQLLDPVLDEINSIEYKKKLKN